MFNFGTWGEIIIILITALVVVGPKDIPKAMKMAGRFVYRVRKVTNQVKGYVDELAFEAQREEIIESSRDISKDDKAS